MTYGATFGMGHCGSIGGRLFFFKNWCLAKFWITEKTSKLAAADGMRGV